jgi:hypothetical protein
LAHHRQEVPTVARRYSMTAHLLPAHADESSVPATDTLEPSVECRSLRGGMSSEDLPAFCRVFFAADSRTAPIGGRRI